MASPASAAASEPASAPKKEQQTKLPMFKVAKPGVKRGPRKLPKPLQRPVRPAGVSSLVKIKADGLVDTKHAPSYLMTAIKRNAVESPLLRLNKDIRTRIWKYAMGSQIIEIKARKVQIAENDALATAKNATGSGYVGKVAHHGPKRAQPKTAFRLPEVCRLIYEETATLGYASNQFAFVGELDVKFGREDGPDGALEGWCRELLPAQINAVASIRPHWHDVQDYLDKNNMRAFRQLFPNLKSIRVASRAVNCEAKWPCRGDPMRQHLRKQAKERIAALVKEQEGQDVEAVF